MIRETVRLLHVAAPTRVVAVALSRTGEHATFLVDAPPHALETVCALLSSVRSESAGCEANVVGVIANGLIREVSSSAPDSRLSYIYALALTEAMGAPHVLVELDGARSGVHALDADGVEEAREAVGVWLEDREGLGATHH